VFADTVGTAVQGTSRTTHGIPRTNPVRHNDEATIAADLRAFGEPPSFETLTHRSVAKSAEDVRPRVRAGTPLANELGPQRLPIAIEAGTKAVTSTSAKMQALVVSVSRCAGSR